MKKIKLNNGLEMPMLGLGTFKNNDENTKKSFENALNIGYTMFDTARVYKNEYAFKALLDSSKIDREKIWITGKVWTREFSDIEAEVDRALKANGLEYFDMYLLHWPRSYEENANAWKQMEKIYQKGKVKSIGISNFQIHHVENLLKTAKVIPVINQVECHPNLPQYNLQSKCEEYGIRLQSYCSFMKNEEKIELKKIADKYNATPYQIILSWLIKRNIAVIPKSAFSNEMSENINSLTINLDEDDLLLIEECNEAKRYYPDPDNHNF